MSRVLKNKLQILRENLMSCFKETLPSKQFNATLSLSIIWLHVLADREEETQDPEERRCIADEFDEGKRSIERGIQTLYEQTNRGKNEDPNLPSKRPLP
jgi:hypothetical protein